MRSIWNLGLKGWALFLIGVLAPAWAQAQDCESKYFILKEGVRLEYAMYSAKDKLEGTQWQEITSVASTPDGVRAEMRVGMKDAKGKDTFESNYGYLCQGNTLKIDFNSLMAGPMQEQFPDAEAEITGVDVEWPNDLSVGMELPDASMQMKMNMGGINMNIEMEITGRKVEKTETVTTPAGTFDCFVIYSETRSKMIMGERTFPSRVWVAEGVGMVKSESYNKNDKLTSSMVLTAFSK